MCIICHAAKKKYIKREEVEKSMDVNRSGFFMAALHPNGTRNTVRTLDRGTALKFFDEEVGEDDAFVMHARIPSVGEKTLDNVHGWEEDKILFCHNMTISSINSLMDDLKWDKTDSEFFFRKLFIPYYRGLGAEAYKDGKFHPDLDAFIKFFCGSFNRFLFIMPDNKVIRYGTQWTCESERKLEDGTIAFWASNPGYKVYSAETGKGKTAGGSASFRFGKDDFGDDYDYDDYCGYYERLYGSYCGGSSANRSVAVSNNAAANGAAARKEAASSATFFDGSTFCNYVGPAGVCKIALAHLVIENVRRTRSIYTKDPVDKLLEETLKASLPRCFNDRSFTEVQECIHQIAMAKTENEIKDEIEGFADYMSYTYEEDVVRQETPKAAAATAASVEKGYDTVETKIKLFKRLLNISLDFSTEDCTEFAHAFALGPCDPGETPAMVSISPCDLLYLGSTVSREDTIVAIERLLAYVKKAEEEMDAEIERITSSGNEAPAASDENKIHEMAEAVKKEVKKTVVEGFGKDTKKKKKGKKK